MEYGVWAFMLFRPTCKSIVFNPCLGLLLCSFCIYMYRSTFKYTYYDGRGTKEFCGHNIGLKGYWGLLKETGMFSFFTLLLSIILHGKSFLFLKTTSKYIVCASDWLCVGEIASINQKHHPDLGSDMSSVLNFCAPLLQHHFKGKLVMAW